MARIDSRIWDLGQMDSLAGRDTVLHRLDPRAKLITTLAFVLVVLSFPKYEVAGLVPLGVYPVALMAWGEIPWRVVARKLVLVSPFALLIGMFNPWFDRAVVMRLGDWPVTGGWLSFLSILMRFVLTVGSTLALVAGTGIHNVCRGLEGLGVPRVFVVQVLFLYRYLFVLAAEGLRLVRARALRSFGNRGTGLRVYGHLLGSLLVRTLDRAQRIHEAMSCRGFEGHVHSLERPRWRWADSLFVVAWAGVFGFLRTFPVSHTLGAWLEGLFS